MNQSEELLLKGTTDPDLIGAVAAMKRAALDARRIAIQTNTGIVIGVNGKPVVISAEELKKEMAQRDADRS